MTGNTADTDDARAVTSTHNPITTFVEGAVISFIFFNTLTFGVPGLAIGAVIFGLGDIALATGFALFVLTFGAMCYASSQGW